MPQTLNATIAASITGAYTKPRGKGTSTVTLGTIPGTPATPNQFSFALPSGISDNQSDFAVAFNYDIALSTNQEFDLTSIVDALGDTIAFVDITGVLVITDAGNTNNVVWGAAAANQFVGPFGAAANTFAIKPNDFFAFSCIGVGWPVTGSTKFIRLTNSGAGTPVKGTVTIIGRSA